MTHLGLDGPQRRVLGPIGSERAAQVTPTEAGFAETLLPPRERRGERRGVHQPVIDAPVRHAMHQVDPAAGEHDLADPVGGPLPLLDPDHSPIVAVEHEVDGPQPLHLEAPNAGQRQEHDQVGVLARRRQVDPVAHALRDGIDLGHGEVRPFRLVFLRAPRQSCGVQMVRHTAILEHRAQHNQVAPDGVVGDAVPAAPLGLHHSMSSTVTSWIEAEPRRISPQRLNFPR